VKGILARHVVHHSTRVFSRRGEAGKRRFSKQGCLETFDFGAVARRVGSGVGVVGFLPPEPGASDFVVECGTNPVL
jgi:hypothetical protein